MHLFLDIFMLKDDFYCRHVPGALNEFKPDLIVYNAGTDILDGDPLGNLMITPEVTTNVLMRL